jgi:CRP-like cAMP-binding protein
MLPGVRLFGQWPAQEIQSLCEATRVLYVSVGQVLIAQGQVLNGLYVIGAGSVEVGSIHDDGRRYVRRYAQPGMLFGLVSVLDGEGSPYSYTAHEPTTILFIPKAAFLSILSRHAELWPSVAHHLASFQRMALATIDEHMFETLQIRLARALVSLAKVYGTHDAVGVAIRIRMTQDNVASLLGVSRQSVSKELKRLEQNGLIRIDYGRITLIDPEAIERAAREGIEEGLPALWG